MLEYKVEEFSQQKDKEMENRIKKPKTIRNLVKKYQQPKKERERENREEGIVKDLSFQIERFKEESITLSLL